MVCYFRDRRARSSWIRRTPSSSSFAGPRILPRYSSPFTEPLSTRIAYVLQVTVPKPLFNKKHMDPDVLSKLTFLDFYPEEVCSLSLPVFFVFLVTSCPAR
jgi:hypothetical protein